MATIELEDRRPSAPRRRPEVGPASSHQAPRRERGAMEPTEGPPLCRELWGSMEAAQYRGDPRGGLQRLRPPGARSGSGLHQLAVRLLLPQGYPHSVSPDYLQYQCWDSVQALCSSLAGALSARAVLEAMGVGDGAATVTGATLTWVLRDGVGMVTRITFACLQGSRLDCEAKQWRLAADVLNDVALVLELLAPGWPRAGPDPPDAGGGGKVRGGGRRRRHPRRFGRAPGPEGQRGRGGR
ncbi:RUS family member 1 [Amazona ochrocephala]